MPQSFKLLVLLTALVVSACSMAGSPGPADMSAQSPVSQGATHQRVVFPATPKITNPYLPYIPGTEFIYDGYLGKSTEHDVQYVTRTTKLIEGVRCVIVLDKGYVNGRLEEKTEDYYAQDSSGNVWYFGEYETAYHPKSHKSSWLAGVNGASPGIVMEATPRVGDTYYQENAPGVAEDQATILTLTANVKTPFGRYFGNVLESKEFSALEPGVVDHKYYEPGIGLMKDDVVRGGREVLSLTGIIVKH
jgi:hypothetical protein